MKKIKYNIKKKDGSSEEIEGSVFNEVWGIDKRGPAYYVLTYVPLGVMVESSRTQSFLKMMVQEPEFFEFDGTATTVPKIIKVIRRYREEYGWGK